MILFLAIFLCAFSNQLFCEESVKTSDKVESVCYFIPPSGWEIAQIDKLSPYVQIGFVGKGTSLFRPSINLALEDVDTPLKEYVKAVKQIHLSEPNTKWRDLGKFPMNGGEGRLTEITSLSPLGEVKILQAIYVKDQTAYILSAAVLKEDLLKIQSQLLKSFQSLRIVPDLFASLPEAKKQAELHDLFATLGNSLSDEERQKQLERCQKALAAKFPEMGEHWQFLALKEGYKKTYSSIVPSSPGQN